MEKLNRRGKALKHVAEMKNRVTGGYHPAYLALVDDWGDAIALVDTVEEFLDSCPPEVRAAYEEYQAGQ